MTRLILLIVVLHILLACNKLNNKQVNEAKDSIKKYNSCINNVIIFREHVGFDRMYIEIHINDSINKLFDKKEIIKYRPIHQLLSTYPLGFDWKPDLRFDKENHIIIINHGTSVFHKYKKPEFDSIQNLIMKNLIIVLIDKDNNEWKIYPCK